MRFIFYLRWLWVSALLMGFQPAAGAYEGHYPGQPGVSAVLVIPAGTGGGLKVTLPEGAYWPDGSVSHSAKNIAIPSQPEPLSFCYSGHWHGSGEQPPSQCYSLLLLPSPEPVTATATDNSGLLFTLLNGVISRLVASAPDFMPGWLSAPVRLDVPDLNEGQQPGLPLATLANGGQGDLVPDFDLSAPQPRFQLVSSRPPVFLELFPQPVMKMAAPDGDGDDDGNPDQLLYYDHDGAVRAINLPPGLPVEDDVRLSSRERALLRRSSPDLNDPDRHYRAIIKSVLKGCITLASHQGRKVYILRTADGRILVLSEQQIEGILFSHSSLGSRHYEHDPYVEFLQTRYHWPWFRFRPGRILSRKPAVQIPAAAPASRIKGDPAGPSSGAPEDPNGKGNNGKGIEEMEGKITNLPSAMNNRDNRAPGNSSSLALVVAPVVAPVVARMVTRASVTQEGYATTLAVNLMLNKKAEAFFVAIETAKEFLTLDAPQEITITLCLDGALQALSPGAADSDQAAIFRHSVQTGLAFLNKCLNKGIDNQGGTFFHHNAACRRNAAGLAIAVTIALSLLSAGEDSQSASIKQTLQWLAEAVTAAGESSPGPVTGELEVPVDWLVALRGQVLNTGANWLLPSSGATPEMKTKVKRLLEAIDQVKSSSQGAQVSAHQHWLQKAFCAIQLDLRLKGVLSGSSPHPANASASASVIPQVQPGNNIAFYQSVGELTSYLGQFMGKVTGIYVSRPQEAEDMLSKVLEFFAADTLGRVQVHHGAGEDGLADFRKQEKPPIQASDHHPDEGEFALATAFSSLGGGGGGRPPVVVATSWPAAAPAHFLNNTVSMVQEKKDPDIHPIFEAKYYHVAQGTDYFNRKPFKEGGKRLGSGSIGKEVFNGLLHSESGEKFDVAVKRHRNTSDLDAVGAALSRRQFGTEINILTRYRHENIIRLIGFSSNGPARCLIYEYMYCGALSHRLDCKDKTPPLDWQQRLRIAEGLAQAINFLHNTYRQAVIHRNVKSRHVLLNEHFQPRLGGFGRAVEGEVENLKWETKPALSVTAQAYMSPEALDPHKEIAEAITPAMDVFALGMVLLELATGLPPYSSKKKQSLKDYLGGLKEFYQMKMLDPRARFPNEVVAGREKRQVQNLGRLLLNIANDATRWHITVPYGAQNIALRPGIGVVLKSLIKLSQEAVLLSSDK